MNDYTFVDELVEKVLAGDEDAAERLKWLLRSYQEFG